MHGTQYIITADMQQFQGNAYIVSDGDKNTFWLLKFWRKS